MSQVLSSTPEYPDDVALAALLVNSNLIALALVDHDRVLFANAAFDRIFDRRGGLSGVRMLDLLLPAHAAQLDVALRASNEPPRPCLAEASRGDGSTFDVELRFEVVTLEGRRLLAVFAQDVTDRFRADAQLNLLAYSDPLTGLGNRALFADRLRQAALTARETARPFALLILDLDFFKEINDRHGHDAGDLVLQRVSARLLACCRDSDTVVRLGGDEFAVLLPELASRTEVMAAAQRLSEVVVQPIAIGTAEVRPGASVGIAIYPDHAATVDHLLAAADRALYVAKRRGRGCAAWASPASAANAAPVPLIWNVAHEVGVPEIDEQHARLVELLNDLAAVLRNGEEHQAALREVIRYTGFHFASEERLMKQHCYGGAAAHRDMHRRLLDDLQGLRLDGPGVSVSLIVRYLQEWLVRHVAGADRDLAAAIHAADPR